MKKEKVFVFAATFATLFATLFIFAAGTDLNNDGTTNRTDISLLATVYRTGNATFDRNNDGVVNLFDMVSVAKNVSLSNGSSSNNSSILWSSDWVGAASWTDNGLWTSDQGNPQESAFPIAGSDGPAGTYLSIADDDGDEIQHVTEPVNAPSAPAVGQNITWRYYLKITVPDSFTDDSETHPVGVGSNGGAGGIVIWNFMTDNDGHYSPSLFAGDSNGKYSVSRNSGVSDFQLDKNVWYRYETTMERLNSSAWKPYVAIYNSTGALLYDTDDFDFTPNLGGDLRLADVVITNINQTSVTKLVGWSNGFAGGNFGSTLEMYRYAAVCATNTTTVGPYSLSTC